MTDAIDEKPASIVGSVLAVPTFMLTYLFVAVVVNLLMTFLSSIHGEGATRWVELCAYGISGFAAVYAGRWILDKAFRAWNGWPTFITLAALLTLSIIADWFFDNEFGWWYDLLRTIQAVVSIIAAWHYLVRREHLN